MQGRLLDHAATLLKPGGALIYCTCSLEADEGENQIAALLARNAALRLDPKVRKPEVVRSYVKALIENKADVNLRDKKEKLTPLQWARKRGDEDVIAMLVKAGAKE